VTGIRSVSLTLVRLLCLWPSLYHKPIPVAARAKTWVYVARLLVLRVRIPPGSWMSLESFVFSGRGLCDGLTARPEESYRGW
jgi:hypothetical protein